MTLSWQPDILPGYEAARLPLVEASPTLGEPDDLPLEATLVRREPDGTRRRGSVLYIHGWNDYFFQTHVADFFAARGYDFYAVDLRRCGRSLRPGQLPGYITDLDEYFVEIDRSCEELGREHDEILLMGHSTGGLIAALWADARPGVSSGLVLNSPWLALQGSGLVHALGRSIIASAATLRPTAALPLTHTGLYAESMHASRRGEWDYDLALKQSPSPPIRPGWLKAIMAGHVRVAAGLAIDVPVLVMCSTKTKLSRRWHDDLQAADSVLGVEQIAARAPKLGRCVTIVRIDRGVHDLTLSAREPRQAMFTALDTWMGAWVSH